MFNNDNYSRSYNPFTNSVEITDGNGSKHVLNTGVTGCATCSCWCNGKCTNMISPMYNKSTGPMTLCNCRSGL